MTIAMMAPAIDMMRTDSGRGLSQPAAGGAQQGGDGRDFFAAAAQRLDWIDQRQRVLAQNIANADTPDYRPRDLSPFEQALHAAPVTPVRTDPNHLGLSAEAASLVTQVVEERAPDGNAVSVENQLTKVADDESASALVGNLWKTTMGMYLTALGHGG